MGTETTTSTNQYFIPPENARPPFATGILPKELAQKPKIAPSNIQLYEQIIKAMSDEYPTK